MRLLAVLLFLSLCPPVLACELDGGVMLKVGDARTLSFRTEPKAVIVGQHFSIRIKVCDDNQPVNAKRITVDARMPAHGHGMNYRPSVTSSAVGEYIARGLLFHMPGHWELIFAIGAGDEKAQIHIDLTI